MLFQGRHYAVFESLEKLQREDIFSVNERQTQSITLFCHTRRERRREFEGSNPVCRNIVPSTTKRGMFRITYLILRSRHIIKLEKELYRKLQVLF